MRGCVANAALRCCAADDAFRSEPTGDVNVNKKDLRVDRLTPEMD